LFHSYTKRKKDRENRMAREANNPSLREGKEAIPKASGQYTRRIQKNNTEGRIKNPMWLIRIMACKCENIPSWATLSGRGEEGSTLNCIKAANNNVEKSNPQSMQIIRSIISFPVNASVLGFKRLVRLIKK
jgi:hypothetical protein